MNTQSPLFPFMCLVLALVAVTKLVIHTKMRYYKNSQEVAETQNIYYQLRIRISQLAHYRQMENQEYIYFLLENHEA